MPFFSFRRNRTQSAKPSAASTHTESVEVVRKRARQRLIGASILVLIAVVGFPLIFDSQPRPVPVDIAIEIPSRSVVKPGSPIVSPAPAVPTAAAAPAASEPAASAEPTKSSPQSAVPAPASLQEREEIVPKAGGAAASPPTASPGPPAVPVVPAPAPAARAEASRAQNLLEGKSEPATASGTLRVVVQVGAFADPAKAREARQKLEKAGLKTYTQVVDTKEGQRTRVRVGPFATREEAEKVAAKVRSLDLPASIRTL